MIIILSEKSHLKLPLKFYTKVSLKIFKVIYTVIGLLACLGALTNLLSTICFADDHYSHFLHSFLGYSHSVKCLSTFSAENQTYNF